MDLFSSKTSCCHRYIDQYTKKCLHCGSAEMSLSSSFKTENDTGFDREHYERLVLMLDGWKKSMIERVESIYKSKLQRVRDEFEKQLAQRRRSTSALVEETEIEPNAIDISTMEFRFIHSSPVDTEYTLMVATSDSILLHDGRCFKLFDENLTPVAAFDLATLVRDRTKVVDLCYVPLLSVYLILYGQSLWSFKPGSNTNLINSVRRGGYISLTTNARDVFILDEEGTLEQRSLISWTFLRKYSKEHLLTDSSHCDHMLVVRFHSTERSNLAAIVRTSNNRRCLMIYNHLGSNTFQIQQRIIFPNANIYTVAPIHLSHVWIVTTCEKQCFFFVDNKREYHQREQQQMWPNFDCDYRVKSAVQLGTNLRAIVLRTNRPSQIRLYHF